MTRTSLWLDLEPVLDVAAAMLAAKRGVGVDEQLRDQTESSVRHLLRRLNSRDLASLATGPFLVQRAVETGSLGLYVVAGWNQRTPESRSRRYRGWES
jgi:hypothetical protein